MSLPAGIPAENLIGLAVGLCLSAACGFRVFVPLLVTSAASAAGYLSLSPGFEWIGSTPALVAFATATVLEILGYLVPGLDHVLDAAGSPLAMIAGTLVAASFLFDMDPFLKWTLAVVAGGGAAGAVHGLTALTRGKSSAVTGGLANPVLSAGETILSFLISVIGVAVPLVCLALVGLVVTWMLGKALRRKREGTKG